MAGVPHPSDLEGYLEGVTRRLAERRQAGTPEPELEAALTGARAALRRKAWSEADARLRAIDARLDAGREEMELTEHPRGLVGYVALGSRGVPPASEEEALANRIRLLVRLASVRRSVGGEVDTALRHLEAARRAYDTGDRATARREADAAHRLLETEPAPPADGTP
jgi:hypothetical protein